MRRSKGFFVYRCNIRCVIRWPERVCNFLPDEILYFSVGLVDLVKKCTHCDSAVGVDGGGCVIAHRVSVNAYVIG